MNKTYKTTAEVAAQEGLIETDLKIEDISIPVNDEVKLELSNKVRLALTDQTGDFLDTTGYGIAEAASATAIFNILGNGPGIDYSFGATKTDEEIENSIKILEEEFKEMIAGMRNRDNVELLDGACDIIVVVLGIVLKHGLLPLLPAAFSLVSHNNLLKLTENPDTGVFEAIRKNGKIQKPEGFEPLDLGKLIPFLKGGDNA